MYTMKKSQAQKNCSHSMDFKQLVADFETTTEDFYNKYGYTRVWAYCICQVQDAKVIEIGNNIDDFMKFFEKKNTECYFHNIKFDGSFIIYWLLNHNFTYSEEPKDKTFSCIIDRTGAVYSITVIFHVMKNKRYSVTFQDSLKKIPLKVKQMSKAFGIKELKGSIDYDLERPEGYELTEDEKKYITNDCVIVAKALKQQFEKGMKKLTIGADSLAFFKSEMTPKQFKYYFPVFDLELDNYFRKSYKGGFVYANPKYVNHYYKGISYDVNSLYPAILHGECGKLPYGYPKKFRGKYAKDPYYPLYIQEIVFMGRLKPNHLPCLQLKGFSRFLETEYLEVIDEPVSLVLTNPDLELLLESYDIDYIEYNGGYKFKGSTNIFVDFIDYWSTLKIEADKQHNEGLRTLCKLVLNNLYGKFGTNPCRQSKYPYLEDGIVKYGLKEAEFIDPVYVPLASFVTAYGRKQTIESANACYDRFLYADTDSIHLIDDGTVPNIKIDSRKLGYWKNEGKFYGKFLHAKTYIKRKEDGKGGWKMSITCASMNESIKNYIISQPQCEAFRLFSVGSKFEGNLKQRTVKGGVVLFRNPFEIR